MILARRGLPKVGPQVAIARELGGDPQNKIGCYISSKKYSLASFFRRWGCALQVVRYSIENFKSEKQLGDFLEENLNEDNDLLISFHHPTLNRRPGGAGHVALIERVVGKYVLLCDPKPKHKLGRKVLLKELLAAARAYGGWGAIRIISEGKYN